MDNYERELANIENEPDIEMSGSQKHRMSSLLSKEHQHKHSAVAYLWIKRFTAVAASVFIVLGCALATVPAVRASVSQTIIAWYNTFVQFGLGNRSETEPVKAHWALSSLPYGYAQISESEIGEITKIRYSNEKGDIIDFIYTTNDNSMGTNNEGIEYKQIFHNGKVYHTFSAISEEDNSTVIWDSDGYLFNISGYCSVDQLLESVWSIERK